MYKEEIIYWKAYRNLTEFEVVKDNNNRKVIKGLSKMIVQIWHEWKADTRHYQPSLTKLNSYRSTLKRGESLLDPDEEHYDTALQLIKDCDEFLVLVVHYHMRSGCLVM